MVSTRQPGSAGSPVLRTPLPFRSLYFVTQTPGVRLPKSTLAAWPATRVMALVGKAPPGLVLVHPGFGVSKME